MVKLKVCYFPIGIVMMVLAGMTNIKAQFIERAADFGLAYRHHIDPEFLKEKPYLMAGGIALGDVNGDMIDDVFVVTGGQLDVFGNNLNPNRLLIADSNGFYTDQASSFGLDEMDLYSSGPVLADFDGDGWKDLLMGGVSLAKSGSTGKIRYYKNQSGIGFIDQTTLAGLPQVNTYSISAGDVDKDGDLDVTLTHWGSTEMQILWLNNGLGSFSDVTNQWIPGQSHPYTFTAVLANITQDSWLDLMVASDFQHSQYFHSNMGVFEIQDSTHLTDDNGMGGFVGDYDNDGDLDWFVTSIFHSASNSTGNRLYNNDGTGQLTDVSVQANIRDGGWGWGGCFADFNNDGWLDIYHTNGFLGTSFEFDTAKLFFNQGDGTFVEVAAKHGVADSGQGRAVVCFDQNNDGKLDILVNNNNQDALFYQNQISSNNHYLKVKLVGLNRNIDAIGARIELTSGLPFVQMRDVMVGNSFLSSVSTIQHFGLANQTVVSELKITWPNGVVQIIENVPADQLLTVQQSELVFVNSFESD